MHKEHVQLLQHFFASLQNHPLLAISESSDAASCLQRGQATCWKAKYLRWSKLYPLTGRCKSTKGELYLRVGVFKAKKLWENLGKTSHPWVDLAPWQLCHEGDPPLEEKKLMEQRQFVSPTGRFQTLRELRTSKCHVLFGSCQLVC